MARRRRRTSTSDVLLRSADVIGWALGGLEREIIQTRERLASLTAQAAKLRARAGAPAARTGRETAPSGVARRGRRRRSRMTPEGRKRISDMMKRRWQEAKKKNRNRL